MLDGWPAVGEIEFLDRHGAPLDLRQGFTPDDDPADVAHFLREAGYLHLRGWLDPADMAIVAEDIDRALPSYTDGDGKSWWANLADGSHVCVRMQDFLEHSPTTEAFLRSDRWDQIGRTCGADDELVRQPVEGRCIEALVKPLDVVAGPSDVSFHRDCHLGRHAYGCSGLTVGVAVTPTSEENGYLRVVAGSHRIAIPVEVAEDGAVPAGRRRWSTEPGDLTVHLSCTLHESLPPKIAPRKVMYGCGFQPRPPPRRRAGQQRPPVTSCARTSTRSSSTRTPRPPLSPVGSASPGIR